ncbi:MAG TPA: four helix bundle protein [Steroidobacteraceae bacterium]|nr:four helix bundle protein [Steroidobacteraceae bacterium]
MAVSIGGRAVAVSLPGSQESGSAIAYCMASRFEDLVVWQRARKMCSEILPILDAAARRRDFRLAQELNECALSVPANIAEGKLRRGNRQFAYFLRIAAGSNGEVRSWLHLAADRSYVSADRAAALIEETNETGKMLESLIRRVSLDDEEPPDDAT